jgi:predicted DCC family thiol-disulfide oxidoreductase YuxK
MSFVPRRLFPQKWNVIYDSKCSLCKIEIEWLKKKDQDGAVLRFTDLENDSYDETDPKNGCISYEAGMKSMSIVCGSSGAVVNGAQAFHEIYSSIGLGWVWKITTLPLIGPSIDHIYEFWARYRTNITRGEGIESLIRQRNEYIKLQKCSEGCTTAPRKAT